MYAMRACFFMLLTGFTGLLKEEQKEFVKQLVNVVYFAVLPTGSGKKGLLSLAVFTNIYVQAWQFLVWQITTQWL